MARVLAVLAAVARLVRRDLTRLNSVAGNNFLVFAAILINSGGFLPVLFAVILLIPTSADPLRWVPSERLALWPLRRYERWAIRAGGIVLSPAVWVVAGLLIWRGDPALTLEAAGAAGLIGGLGLAAPALLRRAPNVNPWRRIPAPPGLLGSLVQKNLRELLQSLDAWLAIALSLAGAGMRWTHGLGPDARMGMTILAAVALSSYAQRLFGRDAEAGLAWYRSAPIRGWQALLAKDAAFVLVSVAVALPLDPVAGLGAALGSLAAGHRQSVSRLQPLARWSFASAALVPDSLTQGAFLISGAVLSSRHTPWALAPMALLAGASLWFFGLRFERTLRRSAV